MKKQFSVFFLGIIFFCLPFIAAAQQKQDKNTLSKDLTDFTAYDLDGNKVTQAVFADYPLTMINIWGTFCSPCLREMPALGEIYQEYAEKGLNVIGIVIDVQNRDGSISSEQVALAKDIVKKTGADYLHLLPSNDLIMAKLRNVSGVPETIFVDNKGNYVGKSYAGARSKAAWLRIIDETLREVKK